MWSGAYQVWGLNNREAAIRVIREDDGTIKHFELKTVDATSNPYLALGVVLAAGLDGIHKKMTLEDPLQQDPATLSSVQMAKIGVKLLPQNMGESLDNLVKDEVILNAMGEDLSKSYLAVKAEEWSFMGGIDSKKEVEMLVDKY
jgi:glutamine synthetase